MKTIVLVLLLALCGCSTPPRAIVGKDGHLYVEEYPNLWVNQTIYKGKPNEK